MRAESTRRLQDVTVALSRAVTAVDVSNTCLEHALASVGAEAGFVVLTDAEGTRAVELVTSSGYDDDELEAWRALDLDADVPFARAVASGEPVSGNADTGFRTSPCGARQAGRWLNAC